MRPRLMRRRLLLIVIALSAIGATAAEAPAIRANAAGLFEVDASPGSAVRYTLDGTDPDRGAGLWLAPIELPAGYTLKWRAFSPDGDPASDLAIRESAATGPRKPSTLVPVTQNRDWQIYDWANRHAACVALMKSRQPEIVMLGDSITHFWGGDPSGRGVAGRRTGADEWDRFFAGRRVVNLGYGWDRTENVLWRLTHGEFDGVTPKVVVVMIGTNNMDLNTTDEIAAGVTEICATLHRRSPSTRILLLGIFPRGPKPDATRTKIAAINGRIARLDGHDGVTYLDIGQIFLEPDGSISKDVMYDFLHPSALGYARWATAMKPTLDRLLAQ
jgi:lysophospholipase L1-like esterase